MAWFNKKSKEEQEKEKKEKNTAKLDFRVTIWEDLEGNPREIKTFEASRFVDEDKTPFIYSEENKFMELYPQHVKEYGIKMTEKEIIDKINETIEKIKTIKKKPIEEYNENEANIRDLEFNLMQLEAKKRALKFRANSPFISFNADGRICFNFKRQGNSFFPLCWDLDTNTIHTASEPVVKKAGILLRNKENKYSTKKLIETATLILLIILIVGTIANLFFGGWLWKKYDQSGIAEVERQNLELQKICSEIVLTNAKAVTEMQDKYKKSLNGTTDIYVNGIIPN